MKVTPEEVLGSSSAMPTVGGAERGHSNVDTSFPFLSQGWSVDVRDGQYRAIRTCGTGMWSTPGNEGWSGREGQPPGSSGNKVQLTPAGEMVDRGEASRHGSCRWGVDLDPVGLRARTVFYHWGAIPRKFVGRITDSCRSGPRWCWYSLVGLGRGSSSVVPPVSGARKHGRGMRPAGGDRRSPQKVKDGQVVIIVVSDGQVVRENTRVVPLSVETEEFSLRTVHRRIRSPLERDRMVAGTVCLLGRGMEG